MRAFLFLLLLALCAHAGDLQLTLPPVVYAVPGVPLSIYYDNVVLTPNPERYRFEVSCAAGVGEARRWTLTATEAQVGDHPLSIVVKDAAGAVIEQGKTTLHISPREAGQGKTVRLLLVGDSLTHATHYPNELARLFAEPGNPRMVFLGTHRPAGARGGVAHEGYGGWTWSRFLTQFSPAESGETAGPLASKATSPFVFPSVDGKTGVFDLPRYFREHCAGLPPDVVLFLLGINDCFGADPENPDPRIDLMLKQADGLLAAFHQAAPEAMLAVGLTTPPNSRQAGFTANYQDRYPRWGWKRIQHRLDERMIEHLSGRESEGIRIVPTELNLDPVDGYPENNGVHPNAVGYAQIAASFHAAIKAEW